MSNTLLMFPFFLFSLWLGIVESFDWFYRCCGALLCPDSVNTQEHISKSQVPGCWPWWVTANLFCVSIYGFHYCNVWLFELSLYSLIVDHFYITHLSVPAGWAFADSVLHRLAPLWVGARGLEFTWDYVLQGLEANANLVGSFSFFFFFNFKMDMTCFSRAIC